MRLRRVKIENYRSIQRADFTVPALCPLIGTNNCGKSNILRAIDLVLGDSWPGTRSVDDKDFYGYDSDRDISISLWFNEAREVSGDLGDPKPFTGIKLVFTKYKRAEGVKKRGDRRTEFFCIDDYEEPVKVLRKSKGPKPYLATANVSREIREALPTVLVDVDRNAAYHLSGGAWSILGRLLKHISQELKTDKARFAEFKSKFSEAKKVLATDHFLALQEKIINSLGEQTGLSGVKIDLSDLDPIDIYKSFFVSFSDPRSPVAVDGERMGAAIQSAVVIALLQAYADLKGESAILLFEEPELFLAPHGRRHLYRLLCSLAERGQQVLYTTHSETFIDIAEVENARIATLTRDAGTTVREPRLSAKSEVLAKQLQRLRVFSRWCSEAFFADSVVLCEGDTEAVAIRELTGMRPTKTLADAKNCSIIALPGADSIAPMMRVVGALGLPMLVVFDTDSDKTDPQGKATARKRIEDINAAKTEKTVLFPCDPCFEGVAGLPVAVRVNKPDRMLEHLQASGGWESLTPRLRELADRVDALAGAANRPPS